MTPIDAAAPYAQAWSRLLAGLVRAGIAVELAEDALQEAYIRAAAQTDLRDPAAWITTAARRIAIDEIRRDRTFARKAPSLVTEPAANGTGPGGPPGAGSGDDRIDLLLLACDPAVPVDTRIPLALRFVLGVSTAAIADVLLVEHPAMSARLTRAKRRLDAEGRRFTPVADALERLPDLLTTVHACYTVAHTAPSGATLGSDAARAEMVDVARAVRRSWPGDPESAGLLALIVLTEARSAGRLDHDGRPVTLEHADRTTWDRTAIDEGLGLASTALQGMGRFALQAGIAGLHAAAPDFAATDWPSVLRLYDRLLERWPSPSVAIARAVALGHADRPETGSEALADLADLADAGGAATRHWHAARADLLRRAGRPHEARAAYLAARALERNEPLRDHLDQMLAELDDLPRA